MSAQRIREAAVAGAFYPDDPDQLESMIERFLKDVHLEDDLTQPEMPLVKAIIAPHAGYVYSGPIAAYAYAHLMASDVPIKRFILIGPAHYAPVRRLALSTAAAFRTPLGLVRVDEELAAAALALPMVEIDDDAHEPEHCLEVQLPFLQTLSPDFSILPLLVGGATAEDTTAALGALWGGPETRIIISSDLSHYHSSATARQLDRETATAIEALRPEGLRGDSACGRVAIQGLLLQAQRHGLVPRTVDLRNSGDTGGPHDRVVGYGAFTFTEPAGA